MKSIMAVLRPKNCFGVLLALMLPQVALGAMISSLAVNGNVGVEVAAFPDAGFRLTTSGSLTLSSVPTGATVVSATLYAHDWFQQSTPSLTFAGTSMGATSAFATDSSASGLLLEAYRWDVTSLVTGNGTYSASASGFYNPYGLALVAVFSDPSLPLRRVVVNDGALQLGDRTGVPDTDSTALGGFGAGSGTLWVYTQADNGVTGETIGLNGTVVGGPIDCNLGRGASLLSIPVTTLAGTNTADIYTPADHFGWHVAVLEGPVPEPATLALLALGGLALIRRRRRI